MSATFPHSAEDAIRTAVADLIANGVLRDFKAVMAENAHAVSRMLDDIREALS